MIEYIKIDNFGPIQKKIELNFEAAQNMEHDDYEIVMPDGKKLLKLAYIYGANASGKTTILKAFAFMRKLLIRPLNNKAADLDFEPFLFCKNPYKHPSSIEIAFYFENFRYIYDIHFNKQSILSEKIVFYQSVKPTELFSRTTDTGKLLSKIQFGSKIKISSREKDLLESNTLHNNTVVGAFSKTNVDIPELEKLYKWLNQFLMGMISSENDLTELTAYQIYDDSKVNIWINSFLNKADSQIRKVDVADQTTIVSAPLDFIDIHFTGNPLAKNPPADAGPIVNAAHKPMKMYGGGSVQREIDFEHSVSNKTYQLSIRKESSGTKRYFGLGGPLYELIHRSHILCIDELDTSLHPDLMKHFLQTFLLNSSRSQLLITTHDVSLLADEDFVRRDALWFSEKGDDGSVDIYSASDFDSTTLRKDASLINAYKSGRLGAKPNLGSPYLLED
jgi:AAA15 family ATPase/GTPase